MVENREAHKVAERYLTAVGKKPKLTPAQIDLLKRPGKIKKPDATVKKLVNMGLLIFNTDNPDWHYYTVTQEGKDLLEELAQSKVLMTPEEIHQVAQMFRALHVETRPDSDRGIVDLSLVDPAHGNTVVDRIDYVTTEADARRIVKNMQKELKDRAQETRKRWRYIPR